jgi:peptide/nickel transport system ATP-binding protein
VTAAPIISVRGLEVGAPSRHGMLRPLRGIDLDLPTGETTGLVGESGCGKSMTARALLNITPSPMRITAGAITFTDGNRAPIDLATLDADGQQMRSIRGSRIAMIFQEPMTAFSPVHTIGDQISEVLRVHEKLDKRAAKERSIEMLDLVGMPNARQRFEAYPFNLSGGMRQRAMIAMALACKPALLVADEPTTALDVTIQAQILELLQRLQSELGMTVLLITHDLGVVARTTRRVAVMYLGEVVEETTTEALFDTPMHPYTQGLLGSVPRLGSRKGARQKLPAMQGSVPPALSKLPGCAFHPRCPKAVAGLCDVVKPVMAEVAPGHGARCLLYTEVLAASRAAVTEPA